jgi:hypothetical protein
MDDNEKKYPDPWISTHGRHPGVESRSRYTRRSWTGLTTQSTTYPRGRTGRRGTIEEMKRINDLVQAIRQYRKLAEQKPLTLQGSDCAHPVLELNKAIDRADALLQ